MAEAQQALDDSLMSTSRNSSQDLFADDELDGQDVTRVLETEDEDDDSPELKKRRSSEGEDDCQSSGLVLGAAFSDLRTDLKLPKIADPRYSFCVML